MENDVSRFFRSRGYGIKKIGEQETTFFYISKGNLGPWCSLVLHLSLVIIVAGVLWGEMIYLKFIRQNLFICLPYGPVPTR
ncbi:cytochrome c biogenesis protein ResB [Desulfoscipio geothermicus]|uniref:cytochrome c biogenesis protein ResB n=1 Tax=Desulfoscipio geothermicus TaxID=39060 RepID=UPI0013F4CAE7